MSQRANASPFPTGLTLSEMREHPIAQLESWLQQAVDSRLTYPTAMILATTDHSGKPD